MPLKILSRRIQKKCCRCQRRKRMLHDYQAKCLKKISPHLFYSTMTYFNIVLAVLSYFFKDKNVLPIVLFTFAYQLPNFSYFKVGLGLFQIHSANLSTRTALQLINIPSLSTHEIELLISEIKERQRLWF